VSDLIGRVGYLYG